MTGCRLTALLVCLFVLTGGSQGFTVEPAQSDIYVRIGGDAEFTVRPSSAIASGNWVFKRKTIVTWVGSFPAIIAEYRSRVNLTLTDGSLVLRSVNESDNGDYRVTLITGGGVQASATITLHALELVGNVNLRSNSCYPVERRDSVLLTCSSQGTQLKREWLLNNQPIQQNDRITISGVTLIIDPVSRTDTGMYRCIVSNGLNNGSAETYLVVFYGPDNMKITPQSPVTIKNGNDLTLTCSAQSMPSPVYVWFNGTERLSTGPKFTISPVSMEHAGKYTCHVNNAGTGRKNSLTAKVIVLTSGLGAGAIVGIVIAVIVVGGGIGGGTAYLIRRKMNRTKAEPGTKYDANRIPRGQTTSATDTGNGLETYENLSGNKQAITHAPEGDSTYMGLKLDDRSVYSELHREAGVIYISPQIVGPNAKSSGERVTDDKTGIAELKYR